MAGVKFVGLLMGIWRGSGWHVMSQTGCSRPAIRPGPTSPLRSWVWTLHATLFTLFHAVAIKYGIDFIIRDMGRER